MELLAAAHHLAWTQYPALWLCESCAILWLVLQSLRSRMVRRGVLLMLCGLMLNTVVIVANAGRMPVVGMPRTLRPMNSTWQAATSNTRLPFLADQAWLAMFSVGDIALIGGGILVLAIYVRRILRMTSGFQKGDSAAVVPFRISGRLIWMLKMARIRASMLELLDRLSVFTVVHPDKGEGRDVN